MSTRGSRIWRAMRNTLAWLGLLLMIVSFAWMQWISQRQPATSQPRPAPHEPFAVVILDPGHGGQDSGAICGAMLEKDITFDVAQRIDRLLQAEGFATVMTRVGDAYVSLAERVALTNRVPKCVLISIHFNEDNKAVSSGIETYYAAHQAPPGASLISWLPFLQRTVAQEPDPESQSLAGFIQEALVARTQAVNRGTKAQQFFVIANVGHPAVLVEGGFLTNTEDIAKLASADYREQIAAAITEGVIRYRDLVKDRQPTLAVNAAGGSE
jgi:N-acetylmuramoyl-L-alanine amidase